MTETEHSPSPDDAPDQTETRRLAQALPGAITESLRSDAGLNEALRPAIADGVTHAINEHPQEIADAMVPVLGPMIRKTVTESLNGMLRSFNETLRYRFSLRGLGWRLEALRTGRSFGDVVLSKTMEYQVEQIFLIHQETGLMLGHKAANDEGQDPMMVSGMLTAIQDFVKSSLGSQEGDALDTLNVGDTTIWVEYGQYAFFAAVIRGQAPMAFRNHLRTELSRIHTIMRSELANFSGDSEPFEALDPVLDGCLQKELKEAEKKVSVKVVVIWTILLTFLGRYTYVTVHDNYHWRKYIDRLEGERGIVVVTAKRDDGKYVVWGLRDSYATDPISILLHETDLAFEKVESVWEPFNSTLPEFQLRRNLENQIVRFLPGSDTLLPGQQQALDEIALNLLRLAEHVSRTGQHPAVELVGHANRSDDLAAAAKLSGQRAQVVHDELIRRGLDALNIDINASGYQNLVRPNTLTEFDRSFNRSVTLRVRLRDYH